MRKTPEEIVEHFKRKFRKDAATKFGSDISSYAFQCLREIEAMEREVPLHAHDGIPLEIDPDV